MMEPMLVVLTLLTLCVLALVFLIIWRDRRDLKLRQVAEDIARLEGAVSEVARYKREMEEMLSTTRRHTEQTVSRVDNQVKQVCDLVASLEQQRRSNRNKKETGRERSQQTKHQKYHGKEKSRGGNPKKQDRQPETKVEQAPKINDGVKYNKLVELAEQGLSIQEIAKKLNLGYDEVALVLELKKKQKKNYQLG